MIKKQVLTGSAVVIACFILMAALSTLALHAIRVGGPLHQRQQLTNEFVADIMPPPEYIIEAMLEISHLVRDPSRTPERRRNLARLEKVYRDRAAYWKASKLDDDLLRTLLDNTAPPALTFWQTVDGDLLPAIERGDQQRVLQAFAVATAAFEEHRAAIEKLTRAGVEHSSSAGDEALRTSWWTMGALALLNSVTIIVVFAGRRLLMSKVVSPLVEISGTMREMARGNLAGPKFEHHRSDELGDMTRAVEMFRTTAIAQRDSEAHQALVVSEISAGLDALAAGNLSHRIVARFAEAFEGLRATFNRNMGALSAAMLGVSQGADRVSTGAGEIGAASADLAQRNVLQAARVEATISSIDRIALLIGETTDSAAQTQATLEEVHHEASASSEVVQSATEAMVKIEASSAEISQIVSLIDGIAFQTNLLALNAGVEAARAGEAGNGFAVVASEVRSLAQRCTEAAADIRGLIATSVTQVEVGADLVHRTGTTLSHLLDRIRTVRDMVGNIAQGAANQAASLAEMTAAAREMDKVTQHNAAMAEESDAAARNLAGAAGQLQALVGRFRLDRPCEGNPMDWNIAA